MTDKSEVTMGQLLESVAHKLSLQAAKLLVAESATSPHPLLTNVFQAMLEARLLPLLEAGQAMRFAKDGLALVEAENAWDAVKAKAVQP